MTAMLATHDRSTTQSLLKQHFQTGAQWNPDDLFVKHSVSEVKAIQSQLRADANNKQEELRLMVGERYRDLLQASTSIVSIAHSSQDVLATLESAKESILLQRQKLLFKRTQKLGKDDTQLQTLQVLSAHVKLLLDTPEHLWHLIEHKKYFEAAWLFLFARLVHRNLMRDEGQDGESWSDQGIDIEDDFPLVQNQWQVISQFRSRIVHRATLFLKDHTSSSEEVCAALLTLHILDSRPLTDTLSLFLSQRRKTLDALLEDSHSSRDSSALSRARSLSSSRSPKSRREVHERLNTALSALADTMRTVREVYDDSASSSTSPSIIRLVIQHLQTDAATVSKSTSPSLSPNLLLTTAAVLDTLPSSTLLLLLPSDLRSYRPYIDPTSSSSRVDPEVLANSIDAWFKQTSKGLQDSAMRWLSTVPTVSGVWKVRAVTRQRIGELAGLGTTERAALLSPLEDVFRSRIHEISTAKLKETGTLFRDFLVEKLSALQDHQAVDNVFSSLPSPGSSSTNQTSVVSESSLLSYKSALRRQLNGRNATVEDVLRVLEACSASFRKDMKSKFIGDDSDSQTLVQALSQDLQSSTEALCASVLDTLSNSASQQASENIIPIIRIVEELSSSSPFLTDLGCVEKSLLAFRDQLSSLRAKALAKWREGSVKRSIEAYTSISKHQPRTSSLILSPAILHSLMTLSYELGKLGSAADMAEISRATLCSFIEALFKTGSSHLNALDLFFLQKLLERQDSPSSDSTSAELLKKLAHTQKKALQQHSVQPDELESQVQGHLARKQLILANLLHPAQAVSIPAGSGSVSLVTKAAIPVDTSNALPPTLVLAKPSARFTLLLTKGVNS